MGIASLPSPDRHDFSQLGTWYRLQSNLPVTPQNLLHPKKSGPNFADAKTECKSLVNEIRPLSSLADSATVGNDSIRTLLKFLTFLSFALPEEFIVEVTEYLKIGDSGLDNLNMLYTILQLPSLTAVPMDTIELIRNSIDLCLPSRKPRSKGQEFYYRLKLGLKIIQNISGLLGGTAAVAQLTTLFVSSTELNTATDTLWYLCIVMSFPSAIFNAMRAGQTIKLKKAYLHPFQNAPKEKEQTKFRSQLMSIHDILDDSKKAKKNQIDSVSKYIKAHLLPLVSREERQEILCCLTMLQLIAREDIPLASSDANFRLSLEDFESRINELEDEFENLLQENVYEQNELDLKRMQYRFHKLETLSPSKQKKLLNVQFNVHQDLSRVSDELDNREPGAFDKAKRAITNVNKRSKRNIYLLCAKVTKVFLDVSYVGLSLLGATPLGPIALILLVGICAVRTVGTLFEWGYEKLVIGDGLDIAPTDSWNQIEQFFKKDWKVNLATLKGYSEANHPDLLDAQLLKILNDISEAEEGRVKVFFDRKAKVIKEDVKALHTLIEKGSEEQKVEARTASIKYIKRLQRHRKVSPILGFGVRSLAFTIGIVAVGLLAFAPLSIPGFVLAGVSVSILLLYPIVKHFIDKKHGVDKDTRIEADKINLVIERQYNNTMQS